MNENRYYNLNEKITNIEIFQILKEAGRRNWGFSIATDLDDMDFHEVEHDDITLRDDFNRIIFDGNIYAIAGFIVIENLKVKSLEVFNGENTIIFFENVIHYNGESHELERMLMELSLSPDYWIKWDEDVDVNEFIP